MMRNHATAQIHELLMIQVTLGIIRSPRTDKEVRLAEAIPNVVNRRKVAKGLLVCARSCFRLIVVVFAEKIPTKRLAGVGIPARTRRHSRVNRDLVRLIRRSRVAASSVSIAMCDGLAMQPSQECFRLAAANEAIGEWILGHFHDDKRCGSLTLIRRSSYTPYSRKAAVPLPDIPPQYGGAYAKHLPPRRLAPWARARAGFMRFSVSV